MAAMVGSVSAVANARVEYSVMRSGLRVEKGVRRVVKCVASNNTRHHEVAVSGQNRDLITSVPANSQRLNQAEELLEQLRKPTRESGRNSETEAVRRLLMWNALPKKSEVQLFSVYEINEHDRDSPAFLPFSTINISKSKPNSNLFGGLQSLLNTLSGDHEHGLGDLVPFTNKIYDSTLRVRLGITAGFTMVVKAYPGKGQKHHRKQEFFFPDRYEAMYTFYLGDMGHISAQGPFSTFEDTLLTVTGGAGLFSEAKGVVHLHNITPFKLFYTFHVRGIPELPNILTNSSSTQAVEPSEFVQPCREAVACKPGFALPNYTD